MEPNVETFVPSRLYARFGWAALAGSSVCVMCGFGAPLAFIPALLCASTAAVVFWLAARPLIRLGDLQFNIGERSIAWREVREINRSRFNTIGFVSPLVLHLKLTNQRRKLLVFPGDADRVERLSKVLRRNSQFATFDGVPYREFWAWNDPESEEERPALPPASTPPVHLFSKEDEEEIERLYQRLKTVGRLDGRGSSPKDSPDPKSKD